MALAAFTGSRHNAIVPSADALSSYLTPRTPRHVFVVGVGKFAHELIHNSPAISQGGVFDSIILFDNCHKHDQQSVINYLPYRNNGSIWTERLTQFIQSLDVTRSKGELLTVYILSSAEGGHLPAATAPILRALSHLPGLHVATYLSTGSSTTNCVNKICEATGRANIPLLPQGDEFFELFRRNPAQWCKELPARLLLGSFYGKVAPGKSVKATLMATPENTSAEPVSAIVQPNKKSKAEVGPGELLYPPVDAGSGVVRSRLARVDEVLAAVAKGLAQERPELSDQVCRFVGQYLEARSLPLTQLTVPAKVICAQEKVPMELMLEAVRHGDIEIPLGQSTRLAECYRHVREAATTDSIEAAVPQPNPDLLRRVERLEKLLDCERESHRNWREQNKDQRREYMREYMKQRRAQQKNPS